MRVTHQKPSVLRVLYAYCSELPINCDHTYWNCSDVIIIIIIRIVHEVHN